MKPLIPGTTSSQDDVNKSFAKVLLGNVSPGNGISFDSIGQPLTFSLDNMSGSIIRIGSVTNPHNLAAHWLAADADLTIAHNLSKIPYGIICIAKYQATDVYFGSIPATSLNITLRTTNPLTDTTIWILV